MTPVDDGPRRSSRGAGPLRVLLVLQSVAVGGMEAHCRYLLETFRRRGIGADIVVPEDALFDGFSDALKASGATVHRLDLDARGGRPHQARRALAALRLLRRYDVVHLHTGGTTGGLLVVALTRFGARGSTVVATEHDVPHAFRNRRERRAKQLVDRLLHGLIAISRRNASLRSERAGAPRVFAAVLNGVPIPHLSTDDARRHRGEVRRRLGIPDDSLVFGSVVRLAEGKGLQDLLRAISLLPAPGSSRLLLVGDGPLRRDLDVLSQKLGIEARIHFAGNQREPGPFIDAMDVFVLAVPAGSMSIALLEAMSRGLPAVITFCGPEEAVRDGETGLGAPPNDPRGLAGTLARLAEDPDLRSRLAAAGAHSVAREFSADRVADDVLAVYRAAFTGHLPPALDARAPVSLGHPMAAMP